MAKALATKQTIRTVYKQGRWRVLFGQLKRGPGRPQRGNPLFSVVGEKLPFDALPDVERDVRGLLGGPPTSTYLAHDSMGQVRYIGRGQVFARLRARKTAQQLELAYFSFYIGMDRRHEREIETVLIRAVGALAYFNTRKKRETILSGDVRDYEAGTHFYERKYTRGARPTSRRSAQGRTARPRPTSRTTRQTRRATRPAPRQRVTA